MILIAIIVCLIGGSAYFEAPLPVQLVLMGLNFLIPDPIPFLDEIIMVGGVLSKLYWLDNIEYEIEHFISEHKRMIAIVLGGIIIIGILGSLM